MRGISINISPDQMAAFVKITSEDGERLSDQSITLEQLKEALAHAGVVYGIDDSALATVVRSQKFDEVFKVAAGLYPIPGEPAQIEYRFTQGIAIKPQELANGKVDFYNLNLIQNVNPGDILAIKTPATPGKPGMTVTGKVVPAQPGKDMPLLAGKNTVLSDDGCFVLAAEAGHAVLKDGRVEVQLVYTIPGDVDFSTGNIDFVGSVVIKGSVNNGFTVKADGDVEVGANVEGGSVFAGGNVHVKKGIQGLRKGTVRAKGNVFAKFIENAQVYAEQDVLVTDAIMHSTVFAGRNIIVGGRKGTIVGGICRAGQEVSSKVIGSSLATVTEIEAGVAPELRERYQQLCFAIHQHHANLTKTKQAITLLKALEQKFNGLPADKAEMLKKLIKTEAKLNDDLARYLSEKNLVEGKLKEHGKGKVKASDVIYPGVSVTIGQAKMSITDNLKYAALYLEDGEIKLGSFS